MTTTRRTRHGGALVASLLAGALLVPAAAAGQASRQTAETLFTEERAGSPSGLILKIDYVNPDDPEGKPPAVQTVVTELAAGASIDTSAVPRCTASDAELILLGEEACPADTRVGGGEVSADTGFGSGPVPRDVENAVDFFNAEDELILLTESTNMFGVPLRTVTRGVVGERSVRFEVPPAPGVPPPDPFLAIDRVDTELLERDGYIVTPPVCPEHGTWTNSVTFTYRDGVTQTVETASPCAADQPA